MTVRRVSALLVRSLRHDARAVSCHLSRGLVVLALYYLLLCLIPNLTTATIAAPGLWLFAAILTTNAFIIGLVATPYFAGVLAEEREEQTLGLLLMSGMNAVTLMVGKSGGRMLTIVSVLAAQVPLMLLCVTFGGVTQLQVLAGYTALFAHLLLVSAIGLYAAVVFERQSSAVRFAVVLWAALAFGAQLLQSVWNQLRAGALAPGWAATFVELSVQTSPVTRLRSVCSSSFTPQNPSDYLTSLISPHEWLSVLLAAFFAITAWSQFTFYEENSRQGSATLVKRRWWSRWRFFPSSTGAVQRPLNMRRPLLLPVFWKDYSLVLGGMAWPVLTAILYPAVFFTIHSLVFGMMMNVSHRLTGALLYGGTLLWLLNSGRYAAALVQVEHTSQAASTLTLLPTGWTRIIGEKVLVWMLGLLPASSLVLFGLFCGESTSGSYIVHEYLTMFGDTALQRCVIVAGALAHAALAAMFTFTHRASAVLGSRGILLAFWISFMLRRRDPNSLTRLAELAGFSGNNAANIVALGIIMVLVSITLFCLWRIRAGFIVAAGQ